MSLGSLQTANAYETGARTSSHRVYRDGVWISGPDTEINFVRQYMGTRKIYALDQYLVWLGGTVMYESEIIGDVWLSPRETLARSVGDCEDFALLNEAALEVMGYSSDVWVLDLGSKSHAICIFEDEGRYGWIDENRLAMSQSGSIRDLAKELIRRYRARRLYALDRDSKALKILYRRGA